MHPSSRHRGYTLIETVVYVAIAAITIFALLTSLFILTRSYANVKTALDVTNEGNAAMERMTREIRDATSVDGTNSVFGSSPGALRLNTASGTVRFYVSNGGLYVDENGTTKGSLTKPNVSVTNLVFRHFSTTTSEGVKVELTVQGGTSTTQKTENYYSFAIVRGSYQ